MACCVDGEGNPGPGASHAYAIAIKHKKKKKGGLQSGLQPVVSISICYRRQLQISGVA